MGIIAKIKQMLPTDGFLREESNRWAHEHFQGEHLEVSRAVAYALVTQLGVDFKQFNASTKIVTELKADEHVEWVEIQMCLEEELRFYFGAKPEFAGRSVSELVSFISGPDLIRLTDRPKRKLFIPDDWCLAGCLNTKAD